MRDSLYTKLDREVALKILPESFAANPDRVMRFEREARVLASINHPHIAQIYTVEEAEPAFLVMELVEGEDLAERMPIARQIADALYISQPQVDTQRLTWFDRRGQEVGTVGTPGLYFGPRLSPDGRRVAVARLDPRARYGDIDVLEEGGGEQRLTFDPANDIQPIWDRPTGRRIRADPSILVLP